MSAIGSTSNALLFSVCVPVLLCGCSAAARAKKKSHAFWLPPLTNRPHNPLPSSLRRRWAMRIETKTCATVQPILGQSWPDIIIYTRGRSRARALHRQDSAGWIFGSEVARFATQGRSRAAAEQHTHRTPQRIAGTAEYPTRRIGSVQSSRAAAPTPVYYDVWA